MKRFSFASLSVAASALAAMALLAGCENSSGQDDGFAPGVGIVTGQVTDINDQPVRGATVTAGGETTVTSMTGAYHLEGVRSGILEIKASVRDEGVDYRGQTFASITAGSQRSNANIILGAVGSLGAIRGTVRDRDGFLLRNVPVFAYNGSGSSARAYTDSDGEYLIRDLVGGIDYEVMATGQGYRADSDIIRVSSGSTPRVDLVLGTPGTPALTAPQNLDAVSWVSPYLTRSGGEKSALDWARANAFPVGKVSSLFRPVLSRAIRDDIAVEAILTWDEQRFSDHSGWGIYRDEDSSGPLSGLEFNADPLSATFQDVGLNTSSLYRYAVTTTSSDYPDNEPLTESNLSSIVTVRTLDRLRFNAIPNGDTTPSFSWPSGSGAQEYAVYVFDQSPVIGVSEIWRSDIVTTTSVTYSGPALVKGRRYYAFVLGLANSRTSRTISEIEEFTP